MHRIGRTGRAGAQGEAISLVCVDEDIFLRDIERLIKREIPREVVPGFEPDPQRARRADRARPHDDRRRRRPRRPRRHGAPRARPGAATRGQWQRDGARRRRRRTARGKSPRIARPAPARRTRRTAAPARPHAAGAGAPAATSARGAHRAAALLRSARSSAERATVAHGRRTTAPPRTRAARRRDRPGRPRAAAAAAATTRLRPRPRAAAPRRSPGSDAHPQAARRRSSTSRALPSRCRAPTTSTSRSARRSRSPARRRRFAPSISTPSSPIARAARAAGARASPSSRRSAPIANSRVFYNRVKGEMEAAVRRARLRARCVRAALAAASATAPRSASRSGAAKLCDAPVRPGDGPGAARVRPIRHATSRPRWPVAARGRRHPRPRLGAVRLAGLTAAWLGRSARSSSAAGHAAGRGIVRRRFRRSPSAPARIAALRRPIALRAASILAALHLRPHARLAAARLPRRELLAPLDPAQRVAPRLAQQSSGSCARGPDRRLRAPRSRARRRGGSRESGIAPPAAAMSSKLADERRLVDIGAQRPQARRVDDAGARRASGAASAPSSCACRGCRARARAPVSCTSAPSSVLVSVDLPAPDEPSSTSVRPTPSDVGERRAAARVGGVDGDDLDAGAMRSRIQRDAARRAAPDRRRATSALVRTTTRCDAAAVRRAPGSVRAGAG